MISERYLVFVLFAVCLSKVSSFPDGLIVIVEESEESTWKPPASGDAASVYSGDIGFEGDINTGGKTVEDWLATFEDPLPGKPGQQGSAIRGNQFRWKGGILPYTMDPGLSATYRATILKAAQHYKEKTCIQVIPRTNEPDYINFIVGRGCGLSYVGKQGGKQDVEVGPSCESELGTVVHELMHALGFFHEQSRTDRDSFVDVIDDNIDGRFASNFNKYDQGKIDHLGIEYDYDSVMHYPKDAFSINGQNTLVPKSVPADRIGQRGGLSDKDVRRVSRLYGCNGPKPTIPKGPLVTPKPLPPKPVLPVDPVEPTAAPTEECAHQATYLFDTDPVCDSAQFCFEVCSLMVQAGDKLTRWTCDGGVCECNACSTEEVVDLVWPEITIPEITVPDGGQTGGGDCTFNIDNYFTTNPPCSSDQFCMNECQATISEGDEIKTATCSSGTCHCSICSSNSNGFGLIDPTDPFGGGFGNIDTDNIDIGNINLGPGFDGFPTGFNTGFNAGFKKRK